MLLPLLMAGIAAVGVLLVFFALAGARPIDPVQARLSQLGSMQATTLEEIELQQPLFDRTLRPLATRLSGIGAALHQPAEGQPHREAAGRWPATRATCARSTSWASRWSWPASSAAASLPALRLS